MVRPSTPRALSACRTSSSLNGWMMASILNMVCSWRASRVEVVSFFPVQRYVHALGLFPLVEAQRRDQAGHFERDERADAGQNDGNHRAGQLMQDLRGIAIHCSERSSGW